MGKSKYKNCKRFRTSVWRAAPCAASHKMNGRRSAPPTKKSEKFLKVKLWSIFMTLLELILSEIPDFGKCRSLRSRKRVGGCGNSFSPDPFSSPQPPPLCAFSRTAAFRRRENFGIKTKFRLIKFFRNCPEVNQDRNQDNRLYQQSGAYRVRNNKSINCTNHI